MASVGYGKSWTYAAVFCAALAAGAAGAATRTQGETGPVKLTPAMIAALPMNQKLELMRYKISPSLLQAKPEMQEFMALNNCQHDYDALSHIFSEFDFPALSDVYAKSQAQILNNLPPVLTVDNNSFQFTLGDYDFKHKAFPFVDTNQTAIQLQYDTLPLTAQTEDPPGQIFCKSGDQTRQVKLNFDGPGFVTRDYYVQFPKLLINEFPIDEAAARKYVYSVLNAPRTVYFRTDVEILPKPPLVAGNKVTFFGQVKDIYVLKNTDGSVIGKLYERN